MYKGEGKGGAESFPLFPSLAPVIDPGLSWPVSTAEPVAMELGGGQEQICAEQEERGAPTPEHCPRRRAGVDQKQPFSTVEDEPFPRGVCCDRVPSVPLFAVVCYFPGRTSNQLLLGREQQRAGPARPQPAVPRAVPHRL